VVICMELGADLHMTQLMPLALTVSCFSKIQIGFTFLVPAHLGSPRKRAVKQVCVCVCVVSSDFGTQRCSYYLHLGPTHDLVCCPFPYTPHSGDESAPIQLAQCRFPGLAISNAKILIYLSSKIYGSNFIKQHSETVTV